MSSIGRYEIESEIGRGAMGIVYLAHDPRLCRLIAIKTCRLPEGTSEELARQFLERFVREAQAVARLSHPNIVTVYDAGEDPLQGIPFMAMEYVPGRSLLGLLREEGRLEPQRAFAMAEALADALDLAHGAGIVHRDIKPANILVREGDGTPKITDFGVARLTTSELTRSGAPLGSPAYMSPEQIRGEAVNGRSDFFSLGIILYELLSGERPFAGEDLTALAYAIAHEIPIPITRKRSELPPGLDDFFDRALSKSPEGRYADGPAFCRALREARESAAPRLDSTLWEETSNGPSPSAPPGRMDEPVNVLPPLPPPPKPRGTLRRWILGTALLLILFFSGRAFWGGKASLKLDGRSTVEAGQLTLLVDGEEVYRRELSAPQPNKGFWGKVLRQNSERFEAWIDVPPGRHEVVAHVLPEGDPAGFRDTIVVEVERGETRELRMVAGRTFGTPVSLKAN